MRDWVNGTTGVYYLLLRPFHQMHFAGVVGVDGSGIGRQLRYPERHCLQLPVQVRRWQVVDRAGPVD